MNVSEHCRENLSYWARIVGDMFPRLRSKVRETLRDPNATEADYLRLIGEIHAAGGWPTGQETEGDVAVPLDLQRLAKETKRAPKQYELVRVLYDAKDWVDFLDLAEAVWQDEAKSTGAVEQLLKRTNTTLKKIGARVRIRRDGERAIADIF